MIRLSQHFTLGELCKSYLALRHGIDNTCPDELVESLRLLCVHALEPIRKQWGPVRVNSGFRCWKLNELVGGRPDSQHLRGEAADIEVAGVDNLTLWRWARDNSVYDQLILEHYDGIDPSSGWVHISWRKEMCRRQAIKVQSGA
jgi:hypothetical protein